MAQTDAETELSVMRLMVEWLLTGWVGETPTRTLTLLIGLASFSGGILLMFRHQRALQEVARTEKDSRTLLFEQRKFRRRTTSSSMVAAMGVFLATLYWINEPRAWAVVISLILILLLGILGLAFLDLMSVSIQAIGKAESERIRKQLVEEYQRQQAKLDQQADDRPAEPSQADHEEPG